jgi:Tfp pilus assembly ATPase PilU
MSETAILDTWLRVLVEKGGSDLLLVSGAPPGILHEGSIQPISEKPLQGNEIESAVLAVMDPRAGSMYRNTGVTDSS